MTSYHSVDSTNTAPSERFSYYVHASAAAAAATAAWWCGVALSHLQSPTPGSLAGSVALLLTPPLALALGLALIENSQSTRQRRLGLVGGAILVGTLVAGLILWLVRATSQKHVDDVHPAVVCEGTPSNASSMLWVIPSRHGDPIDAPAHSEWCSRMRALERAGHVQLGMHGVDENHNERDEAALEAALASWRACFGAMPRAEMRFAPAGGFFKSKHMYDVYTQAFAHIRTLTAGLVHRIYHCNDTFCGGAFLCANAWLDVF